jgi:MATE family multidrug resistance protein
LHSLDRQIFRLAIPNILAAISAPLIGIADTAMIGHLPEVAYMGAVATAGTILSALYWSAGFLRMGTTSMVAQYFGARDCRACVHTLYRSLAIALVLGLALVFMGEWIGRLGFALAGGSAQVQQWGQQYLAVRLWEAPLVLVILTLNGFFLGTANALAPLYITFTANLVNLAADYALIFGHWGAPELGVVGAAWAAVLGSGAALLVGLVAFLAGYREYLKESLEGLWALSRFGLIFRTNSRLFGRTLCLQFAQFAMLGMVSRLGEVPLAANAVIWQLWNLSSFGIDGFAHAAETLVGNRLGRRDFAGARQMARRILQWSAGVGGCFGLVYLVALEPLAALFTQHGQVIGAIVALRLPVALVQPINAFAFAFDGIFIGANDLGYLFQAMAAAVFAAFVPLALVFVYWLGLGMVGAWLAYDGLMVGRAATLGWRYGGEAWLRTFVE